MGFNSTIVVMNDALGSIETDDKFGAKVSSAIQELSIHKNIDIASGNNVNAATAIETHHADGTALIAVGGNCASVLGFYPNYRHNDREIQFRILQDAAEKLGFTLVKKRTERRSI